jgi:DNA-binding NarL/FixJ family response regulator
MIRILLADDHHLVRAAMRRILEMESTFEIVGEVSDGNEILREVQCLKPNLLLLDLSMPNVHGLEVLRSLSGDLKTKVLVVSMHNDEPYVIEALRNGAAGYILKDDPPDLLVAAVKSIHKGGAFLSPGLKQSVLSKFKNRTFNPSSDSPLTTRELEVLNLAAGGLNNGSIAERLGISQRTVEAHRSNFRKKLGLKNQTDLVRYAIRLKLLEP